ncbi:MAG: hypothetical protein M5U35_01565 [Roseovarius sp.]|nr:hypothetical protein [Roseovarius sp.]
MTVLPSVIEAIGGTPLVELGRIGDELGLKGRLLAKLDYLNPGFPRRTAPPEPSSNRHATAARWPTGRRWWS